MPPNKILLFGAGKIGRSFIGQLFGQAGYELVFADIDQTLIDLLNQHGQYRVVIKSEDGDGEIIIRNVCGLHLSAAETIVDELANASLASVSVGQQGLPALMPLLAEALIKRNEGHGLHPLDIIIAENMRHADRFFIDRLTPLLPEDFPLVDMLGLVETSIGKMVPIMTAKDLEGDPLQVFAEPYNTLIVDRKGFRNPIPQIEGLAPKENIKAWVDRKLFIHNLGHAAVAYLGYRENPEYVYMYEALDNPRIFLAARSAMVEAASVLQIMYPNDFSRKDLLDHISDLLTRFRNRALGDTIYRVGCDLYRKLGPEDRFSAPLKAALTMDLPFNHILGAMDAALAFRATDHEGNQLEADKQFISEAKKDLKHVLQNVSGFTDEEVRLILRNSYTK